MTAKLATPTRWKKRSLFCSDFWGRFEIKLRRFWPRRREGRFSRAGYFHLASRRQALCPPNKAVIRAISRKAGKPERPPGFSPDTGNSPGKAGLSEKS
jgi:hypothetical protein